jgi:CheY-like chemotaxis protein
MAVGAGLAQLMAAIPAGGLGRVDGSGSPDAGARWRIFISHTSELRNFPAGAKSYVAEAERAIAAAGHVIVDMADFPAADQPAAELCAQRVRSCDVYVGVLGTRYGSPVPDRPEMSYTELEFDAATAAGLPRLMFVLNTGAADVGIPLAQLIDYSFGARQEAFRRRVQASGLVTQSFASPDELGRLVERSLRELADARQGAGPLPPDSVLRVWSIPARNPVFTGRDELLAALRDRLLTGGKAVVQALEGMGGVGKTQLAIEYAHRFAADYDVTWWINAEQAGLIGEQFAALGAALGCIQTGADSGTARAAVLADLRQHGRWLLVFDNAENPAAISPWLPGGGGHVLITSRARAWGELATPVEVDVLARTESVALLQHRMPGLGAADASRLAAQLGDLPLAVAQAAAFMAETSTSADGYLELLRTQAGKLLDQAAPGSPYPRSLASATRLAADRLEAEDPAAAQLASLCAFLAPEPIPEYLFTGASGALPGELAARAGDPLGWRQTLGRLTRQSLSRIDQRGLVMHRLTQAILRDRLTAEQAAAARACTEAILIAANPRDQANPVTWPRWAQLMPHLLAADLAATDSQDLRWMACNACAYLLYRGDTHLARDLAAQLHRHWRSRLGDNDEHTQEAALYLAWALRDMGRYAEARELDEDTLARRRRVLGDDHTSTLSSATSLANVLRELGEYQAARELDEDTLARRRRLLGDDHRRTLISASNLAADQRALGEYQAARELDEDTLARRRRVLGDDHPRTLGSASDLADDQRALGEYQAARELDEDTLARRRRVLGDDHPDTLTSASNLAWDLASLGDHRAARELNEDTLARRRRVLGDDHPSTLWSASNLAASLASLGDHQAARELDEDTLARRRRVLGDDHPDTQRSLDNLAADLRALGEPDKS